MIGGVGYTPAFLRAQIKELKEALDDKNAPFGIDLLLPMVGGTARKTNKDYTGGKLNELVDIIIEEKAALFVCAVGVPPKEVVDRLHAAGIPVMNMVGAVKHCEKALAVGVDLICAQGGEGGGHTGDIATSILIPACVSAVKGRKSPLTGEPIQVSSRPATSRLTPRSRSSLLVASTTVVDLRLRSRSARPPSGSERGSSALRRRERPAVTRTRSLAPTTTTPSALSVRPLLRFPSLTTNSLHRTTPSRAQDAVHHELGEREARRDEVAPRSGYPPRRHAHRSYVSLNLSRGRTNALSAANAPYLMGQVAAMVKEITPAKQIVEEMVAEAIAVIHESTKFVSSRL